MNHTTVNSDRRIKPMPFWEKYTLTVGEASSYFHIGEKKLREIIEENPTADFILMSGKRIMIKRTSTSEHKARIQNSHEFLGKRTICKK